MAVKKRVSDNLGLYLLLGALVLVVLFYQPGILLAPEDDLRNCQERLAAAKERLDNAEDSLFFANANYNNKDTNYLDIINLHTEKHNARENLIAEGSQMSRDILDIEDQITALQEERRTAPGDQYDGIDAQISALQTSLSSLEDSKIANSGEVTAITNEINNLEQDKLVALDRLDQARDRLERAQREFDRADIALRILPSCESSYVPDKPYVPWVPPTDSDSSS